MNDLVAFLVRVNGQTPTPLERAFACLWWVGHQDSGGLTTAEICRAIEDAGHPQQNSSRLDGKLSEDRRTTRIRGSKAWRLTPSARAALDAKFGGSFEPSKPQPPTDSVLPRALFNNTRGYLEKVVHQINGSYDAEHYDCCAVMCRRLLETLIIETYEQSGRAAALKGRDGHFLMFADLLRTLVTDGAFNISRNAKKGLEDFKRLGDLSAHSRRYNAHRDDIDRVRDGVRVASEELLHLAKLA